jgi:SOS-response transcriptional repressor LexA
MAARTELTAKQAQCLEVITTYIVENGYPPSLRDICTAMGWSSTNCAVDFLNALEKKGRIRRLKSKHSRAIQVVGLALRPEPSSDNAVIYKVLADIWERRARALGWRDDTELGEAVAAVVA